MDLEDYDVLNTILTDDVADYVEAMTPGTDAVFERVAEENVADGVAVVGPAVGGVLRVLARLADARRAFDFGSGRGYSAYWIAPVLPPDGDLVLTDFEAENMEYARAAFEEVGTPTGPTSRSATPSRRTATSRAPGTTC